MHLHYKLQNIQLRVSNIILDLFSYDSLTHEVLSMIVARLKLQTYNEAQKVLVIQHPMLSSLLTRVYGATKSKKMLENMLDTI